MHLLKIVHGDLKPSNILISIPKGGLGAVLKLTDFNLHHADSEEMSFRLAFTKGWMCPTDESDEEGSYHTSFDIFPLGCILGFAVSRGIHPFGSGLDEAIERIENKQPMQITLAYYQHINSASFFDILDKMLSYDSNKRPTATQILGHPFFKKQSVGVAEVHQPLAVANRSVPREEVRKRKKSAGSRYNSFDLCLILN